ncbi:hypothetical protein [Nitrospina watsonii]|uniref:Uncharacterized protein n=1 Tax=Nitrospina watsonii TaxID=1323948 RepID=A0ABN8VYS6_9BACT|nr:hypothetical protein [Nitrospina watsonii]CAI2717056.1 conserved protein of unknown function [Nitrospina watsonii]
MDFKLIKLDDAFCHQLFSSSQPNKLPNSISEGSYDIFSQAIELNIIEKCDVEALSNPHPNNKYPVFKKVLPLLAHEQAHWVDYTSTLFGFQFLYKVYYCFYKITNENTKEFYKKNLLFNEINKIKFPEYYSTKFDVDSSRPWKYTCTAGQLFNKEGELSEYPIFFTSFLNKHDELIARQPFSLCSLFEASSTNQEILAEIDLINSFLSDDEKSVEIPLNQEKFLKRLYSPDLTEYSIAAHKLANSIGTTDSIEAYKISATLAHLCFNFPSHAFRKFSLEKIYEPDDPTLSKMKIALEHNDRAALFYFLTDLLRIKTKPLEATSNNIEELITKLFDEHGITISEMENSVEQELKLITDEAVASFKEDAYIQELFSSGVDRFKKLGIFGTGKYPFKDITAPGAVLGDGYFFDPYNRTDTNIEERYSKFSKFLTHLESFSNACIF